MKSIRFVSMVLLTALLINVVSLISPNAMPIIEIETSTETDLNASVQRLSVIEYDFSTQTEQTYYITIPGIPVVPNENDPIVSPNVIVPPDLSSPIPSDEYDIYPHSAVCKLGYRGYDNNGIIKPYIGSGFIVGKRIVLTAAHCVFSHSAWDIELAALPHSASSNSTSYILSNGAQVLKAIIPASYKSNPSTQYDWAILIVDENVETGNGKFQLTTEAPAVNGNAFILSYPNGVFTYSPGYITEIADKTVKYTCDTLIGSSGGPVYRIYNYNGTTTYSAFAVHSTGATNNTYNMGCRINSFIIAKVGELNGIYT